jgi:hypothetical protein
MLKSCSSLKMPSPLLHNKKAIMAQGYSIHIGVNTFDKPYPLIENLLLELTEQEKYATKLFKAFRDNGFESTLMDTSKNGNKNATSKNFVEEIKKLQEKLTFEDLLVISFCGHGVQWEDEKPDKDEEFDENWAFYDRAFSDDELNQLLCDFKNSPRIIVISNCCHASGMSEFEGQITKKKEKLTPKNLPNLKKTARILWLSATTKHESIPSNSPAFVDAIINQLNAENTNYNDFFANVIKLTNNENFKPNILPLNPKIPDFRLESPFIISNLKRNTIMSDKTKITGADVVSVLQTLNKANAQLIKLPQGSKLRKNADAAVEKMKDVRLRDGANRQKSLGEYNRGFAFTKSELENLIKGATFPDDFLGIQLCLGIKNFDKKLTFGNFNGKKVTAKLDSEIFPVISLITTSGMSSEMYAPEVKDCIEVAGIKCPPLICPPPPPPGG